MLSLSLSPSGGLLAGVRIWNCDGAVGVTESGFTARGHRRGLELATSGRYQKVSLPTVLLGQAGLCGTAFFSILSLYYYSPETVAVLHCATVTAPPTTTIPTQHLSKQDSLNFNSARHNQRGMQDSTRVGISLLRASNNCSPFPPSTTRESISPS